MKRREWFASVDISDERVNDLKDLCLEARIASFLANQVSYLSYDLVSPGYGEWDEKLKSEVMPDPLRTALKVQKFSMLAAGGLLSSTRTAVEQSILNSDNSAFYGMTPLSPSVLARSTLEALSMAIFIAKGESEDDKVSRMLAVMDSGMKSYHWFDKRKALTKGFYAEFAKYRKVRGQKKTKRFQVENVIDGLGLPFPEPYKFLSNYVHCSAHITTMATLDCQEQLGFNFQSGYWSLAIAVDSVYLAVANVLDGADDTVSQLVPDYGHLEAFDRPLSEYIRKRGKSYREIVSNSQDCVRAKFWTACDAIESGNDGFWGTPKDVPDRDLQPRDL